MEDINRIVCNARHRQACREDARRPKFDIDPDKLCKYVACAAVALVGIVFEVVIILC